MNAQNAPTITAQILKNVAIISIDVILSPKVKRFFMYSKYSLNFLIRDLLEQDIQIIFACVREATIMKTLHLESWHPYFAT